jgi:hypothetical protein
MSSQLAAAFYVPQAHAPADDSELIAATGLSTFPNAPDGSGRWAGMTCWPSVERLPYHALLILRFWASDLLALLDEDRDGTVESDGAYRIALAFRNACEALHPDIAFVVTHPHQAEREWILGREWMVLARDLDALVDEQLGLLYIAETFSSPEPSQIEDRDQLPCRTGLLLFAGRGPNRWF